MCKMPVFGFSPLYSGLSCVGIPFIVPRCIQGSWISAIEVLVIFCVSSSVGILACWRLSWRICSLSWSGCGDGGGGGLGSGGGVGWGVGFSLSVLVPEYVAEECIARTLERKVMTPALVGSLWFNDRILRSVEMLVLKYRMFPFGVTTSLIGSRSLCLIKGYVELM